MLAVWLRVVAAAVARRARTGCRWTPTFASGTAHRRAWPGRTVLGAGSVTSTSGYCMTASTTCMATTLTPMLELPVQAAGGASTQAADSYEQMPGTAPRDAGNETGGLGSVQQPAMTMTLKRDTGTPLVMVIDWE